MHFELDQRFAVPLAKVAATITDPDYYDTLAQAPKLGTPEVLSRKADGDIVVMQVRYRFAGELSSAARAVVDPAKLTWVEHSTHDLAAGTGKFRLEPDNYEDRFEASGGYRLQAPADDSDSTIRLVTGALKVRVLLVGSAVERAIVSGLQEHLDGEVDLLEAFVAER